jgi:hypothetical protein
MAKDNNARGKDTPIRRAAREIATARSKARNAVANSTMSQKRVTRSSGLLSLIAGGVADEQIEDPARGAKGGRGDKAKSDAESDEEDVSDVATTQKKSTARPDNAASSDGESSDSEAALGRSLGTNAVRKSRARRDRQAASSDSDKAPAAMKKARTRSVQGANEAGDKGASSEGDCSDTLTRDLASKRIKGGGMNKKKDGSSDKFRELERKLRDAEGRCLERSERTPQS